MTSQNQNGDAHGDAPASREGDAVTISRHADVVHIACNPGAFSSAVSRYRQLPNGLDGDEHARFRALVDRYFTPEAMAEFAPACRIVAGELVAALPRDRPFDAVRDLGAVLAVRAQSAWLGWPAALEQPLLDWLESRQDAIRTADPALIASVAERFDAIVLSMVDSRRAGDGTGDVTDRLVHDTSLGRRLEDEEIVSILRNWTGGDLGSIALSVGVVVHALAARPELAARLRDESSDEPFDLVLEECLRLDDPFIASRRVAVRDTDVRGNKIAARQRIRLDWATANRDPDVFAPGRFEPERHAAANLVYGVGPHACPGRPLARLELRELVRALLAAPPAIALAGTPLRESPPLGGYRRLPVRFVSA